MKIRIFISVLLFFIVIIEPGIVGAAEITLKTQSGETIEVIYSVPEGKGKHPAIIYNHGTFVRKLGYSEASSRGYDINDFVKALNKAGFVGIAPIRKEGRLVSVTRGKANIMGGPTSEWNNAVVEGLEAINAVLKYLKEQSNVDSNRIGIIGFSEGGNITLWSSLEHKDFKAIVLMSPANLDISDEYNFSKVLPKLEKISAPIFLTLGETDIPIIFKNCTQDFIPLMKKLNKEIEYKIDYPGNHDWFYKVRAEYWNDIIRFLNKRLK
ncbi:MAG: dienelactone hydrolase family protein [Thermodesulfovibrionales bacterium]|nr:dienelactone hydrolase family protein [Thermodesulfovibrionales bacterium]